MDVTAPCNAERRETALLARPVRSAARARRRRATGRGRFRAATAAHCFSPPLPPHTTTATPTVFTTLAARHNRCADLWFTAAEEVLRWAFIRAVYGCYASLFCLSSLLSNSVRWFENVDLLTWRDAPYTAFCVGILDNARCMKGTFAGLLHGLFRPGALRPPVLLKHTAAERETFEN